MRILEAAKKRRNNKMKIEKLKEDMIHYIFETGPNKIWTESVTVIVNKNKAILIDAGYEFQIEKVLADLHKKGIEIEKVIITHFHEDHMRGLNILPKVPIYGSSRFQETLDKWTPKNEHDIFTPTVMIDKPQELIFGKYKLTLIPFPGHSVCGMLININDEFLHVVDELMFSQDGIPLLPSSDDFKRHLESLDKLRKYSDFTTLIPSHGPVFNGGRLEEEIGKRYAYINALIMSNGNISYEEAIKDCNCIFPHSEWHEGNCKNVR
jgi:glyoxylase-like metal-dependent hydrolase (beta-lactamase superfamily II)